MPILIVDVNKIAVADIPLEFSVSLIFREGQLQNAALYFDCHDLLLSDENRIKPVYDSMITQLEDYPQWVFLADEKDWLPGAILPDKPFINIELPIPSYPARRQLWERHWHSDSTLAAGVDFSELAGKFRLSGGQIRDAAATSRSLAQWRDPERGLVTIQDLYAACRQQFRGTLNAMARKVPPNYDWADIILPKDATEQLYETCSYVKQASPSAFPHRSQRRLPSPGGLRSPPYGPRPRMQFPLLPTRI
ncbi:hypothetical protein ACFLYR_08850 [Chloroflexota bacterium]